MNFNQFLVIDKGEKIRTPKRTDCMNTITVSGEQMYPLEQPIPIITKNTGCFYMGMISEVCISKTRTTVTFIAEKIDKEQGKALYAFFRNVASSSCTDDPYENTDTIIPGIAGNIYPKHDETHDYNDGVYNSPGSLSDYLDDDSYDGW